MNPNLGRIELLNPRQADVFLIHLERHFSESGRDGKPIFAPFSSNLPHNPQAERERLVQRWRAPVDKPGGWERAWALWQDQKIVGHIDLNSGNLASRQHRARLGMGIEQPFRAQGWGRKLMETALTWARDQPGLEWIDLGVFGHNLPALKLYQKLGFSEEGRTVDAYRVNAQSIEDVQMSLRLHP